MATNSAKIDETLARLRGVAALARGTTALRAQRPALGEAVIAAVISQVGAFSDSANPQTLPLLERHMLELVDEYLQLLSGEAPSATVFVERYSRAAAERYFPLESVLHAYRIGLQYLLKATIDALLLDESRDRVDIVTAATDFLLEFINVVSAVATEHYLDQSRLLANVASDQRSELLSILLEGYDESDRRVSTILRDAGLLDRRMKFCVVLAQSNDPTEMRNPARARRLADHIDRLLAHIPGDRLIDIHRNKATIVFSHLHRLSGWSQPRAPLATRVAAELLKLGTAARLGVSNEVDSTGQIPAAYRQASLAFDASGIGNRVVRFADIPLQQLLLHFAGEDFARVLPEWATRFLSADAQARGRLSATLRAYAGNDMNLLQTARQLGVHANTIYARFDRIAALSGRDPRGFKALNELLIVYAADSTQA